MEIKKCLCVGLLGYAVWMTGCTGTLPDYENTVELRVYGSAALADADTEQIGKAAEQYAECLFNVGEQESYQQRLKELAPYESAEEWEKIYRKNKTKSVLEEFLLADIYTVGAGEIQCITVCEAQYEDRNTPEDLYVFLVSMDMEKGEDGWRIRESELLSTSCASETKVIRDDFTETIKVVTKGGEMN